MTSPNLSVDEIDALQDLYDATNGANWDWETVTSNAQKWNFSAPDPADYWQGVSCACHAETNNCTLTSLILTSYNLVGYLPNSIGTWGNLSTLSLYSNKITGTIPNSIGKLRQLTYLDYLITNYHNLIKLIPKAIFG